MKVLDINLTNNSYQIFIENDILAKASNYIEKVYNNKKIFIVTDDCVSKYHLTKLINSLKDKYDVDYVEIKNGEESKNIMVYQEICTSLINKGIKRGNLLIALGGGVIGDITGFVAATLYRGLPYIGIPTTLLSQMDSSIGGKTAIDFDGKKNIIGAFKQPLMVLIDPLVLKTLSDREFNNGMGELIKHAAIGNINLLEKLKNKPLIDEDIIVESLSVKKRVVEIDEFDLNERMLLNFGHTFGHAIELKYGYKHGEAVSIGILMAIKLGIDLGITPKECYNEIENILKLYNLPTNYYDYHDYLNDIMYDKKNISGTIRFILLDKLGNAIIYKLTEEEIKENL